MNQMADRKKVIKGLECCSMRNGTCKYAQEPICPYVESCRAKDYSALKRDALELLKEQEAVKIEVKKINGSGRCGRCPNCLMELNEMDYPYYCGFCGKAVKWE